VDQVVGDLTFRIPIGDTFAPYVIGSGGRAVSPEFSPAWDWIYGGGVGFDLRFDRHVGLFSDARFFWAKSATENNRLLLRAGLRIAF
jgi:hypothetical protein